VATSAETAVRLLQIGWNADVREAARKVMCPVFIGCETLMHRSM
jgi:hypothetical protein